MNGISETVTNGCAVVSLATPFWLPLLHDTIAYWAVPILGATWLLVQIFYKIKHKGL